MDHVMSEPETSTPPDRLSGDDYEALLTFNNALEAAYRQLQEAQRALAASTEQKAVDEAQSARPGSSTPS